MTGHSSSFEQQASRTYNKHQDSLPRGRSQEFASGATPAARIQQVVKGRATDEVHLTDVSDLHSDQDLAKRAGYDSSHQGYNVTRYPDSPTATVSLWKQ